MNYFNISEFDCKCGCGTNNMDPTALDRLNVARFHAGIPFVITSGCRCGQHNAAVSTVGDTSPHLGGWAVDISATSSAARWAIVDGLKKAGFTRIGIGSNFVHADIDPAKTYRLIWTY